MALTKQGERQHALDESVFGTSGFWFVLVSVCCRTTHVHAVGKETPAFPRLKCIEKLMKRRRRKGLRSTGGLIIKNEY